MRPSEPSRAPPRSMGVGSSTIPGGGLAPLADTLQVIGSVRIPATATVLAEDQR